MKIHFTGIAGAGMAAVAQMMQDAGHEVSGSDQDVFPPMSTFVEGLGLPVAWHLDAANLPADLDVLVQGASAKLGGDDNVEARAARERRVRVTTFPELVGDLTRMQGEVTGKRKEGGEALIDIRWWGENQRGEKNCDGTAVVRLPSRDISLRN